MDTQNLRIFGNIWAPATTSACRQRRMQPRCLALAAAAAALLGGPCTATAAAPRVSKIVYLMLENRAFDHMLGWLGGGTVGLTGSESNPDPNNHNQPVPVNRNGQYRNPDPGHGVWDTAQQMYGRCWGPLANATITMGGFVANAINNTGAWADGIMDCFAPPAVPVISALATQFAVLDGYHASIPGPTFVNRLYALSGTSWGYGDNDDTQTVLGWPQRSIFQALTDAGVDWRIYFEEVATAWLLNDARPAAALNRSRFMYEFDADARAGRLPAFTWLDPSYFSLTGIRNATDQHPDHDVQDGEFLMKRVYEALRASPDWNNTVLIVTYDEHGGFYDAVPPPTQGVPNPDGVGCKDCSTPSCGNVDFNFTRLGVRVPMIVVSPWVAAGTVVHAGAAPAGLLPTPASQYDHASLPATLRAVFNTTGPHNGFLTARDAWSIPLHWIWEGSNLTAPRTDCPATLPVPPPSPVFASRPAAAIGTGPVSHLQRDLLHLIEGVARGAGAAPAAVRARVAAVAGTSESQAGAYAVAAAQRVLAAAARQSAPAAPAGAAEAAVDLEDASILHAGSSA